MTGKPTENPESSLNHAGTVVAADPAQAATVGRQISASDFSFSGLYQDRPLSSLLPAVAPNDLVAGRYLIGAKLGEGGMGSVYLAEQLQPVRRQVAFKVMQPGQLTSQLVARFEAERQTLALMDHPNIARIFDGGILGDAPGREAAGMGQPFFVMELVSGLPLNDYCDQKRLTPRERIELFIQVCAGVQHAHQKGVIHRDLKPNNVLVAEYDGKPVPKIIDFGIAKAQGAALASQTLETAAGSIVGMPEYMSPEQANPIEFDVDTRSDIYSLGVILYELLTGGPPFDRKLLPQGLWDLLRVIREEEPPLPSTKLGSTPLPSLATNRGLEPRQLLRQVRGDLDWIVMKALAKEPDRRYQSAHELALDLRRFLADEPVQAGPPSRGYRLRKFIRRNKPMVIAATLILLVLLAGVAGTTWGWLNAQKAWAAEAVRAGQEKRAKEQAQLANATAQDRLAQLRQFTRILARIFADANPRTAEKEGKPLYELFAAKLHEATSLLNAETLNDPVTAAELQTWLASAHSGLGYPERALPLLEKAHATFRERQGPNHQNTLRAQASLAEVLLALGKEASGLPLLEQSVQQLQATLGPDHPDSLAALGNLAIAYRRAGRLDAALRLQEEVLRRRQATAGSLHADTLNAMQNLAVAYRVAGKADRAAAMLQETWKLRKETLGETHPDTLRTAVNLGQTYGSLGKLELALPLLRDALSALTTKLGREHPDTLGCIGNLGLVYRQLQKPDLALPLFQEHHRLSQARQGPEHPSTLNSMNNLALGYQAAGQTADALPLFQEVLRLRRAKLPADHPDLLSAMNNVAAIFFDVGRRAEAITLYEEGLQLCKRKLGQEHPNTLLFMTNLADCYEKEGQHARALPLLKEAAEGVEKLGFNHPHAGAILPGYLAALERAGQVEEALRWWPKWIKLVKERRGESLVTARLWTEWCLFLHRHHRYAEAEEQLRGCLALRRKLQPDHWLTYAAQGRLGTVLLARKKHDQAEPLLLEACRAIRERAPSVTPEDRHQYAAALASLIQLYRETGRPADAEPWRRELLFQMPHPPAR